MFPLHDALNDLVRAEFEAYDDLTAALLARRGMMTKKDAEMFLNPSYDLHVHDPMLMTDMPKAAERLAKAILSSEKIVVWTDYDCDGIPAATLLHDFLEKAGANFENYIPHRHLEGYGVNVAGIEKLVGEGGAKLIVTADVGITDHAAITRARELGADVIVTDHHLPRSAEASGEGEPTDTLPDAFAVVNPNARENETYPYRSLCGTGVAWKLVCATLAVIRTSPTSPRLRWATELPLGWEKWLLDMVALATIADMVPLTGENRVLATYGLLVMRKSPRIGLQKLLRGARVEQRAITEDDVGFMIAPRINAASRMGDARDAFALLSTTDENEADALAKKLEKINRERKAAAGAITRAVHTRLSARGGSASGGKELPPVIVMGDPDWRPGLLGLVANGIADEYERPVFLWGREGNLSLKGSVRSGGSTHILELMRATEKTFVEFGGHAAAGGFSVLDTEVFYLEDRLVLALRSLGEGGEAKSDALEKRADAAITPDEVSLAFLKSVEKLAPFGQENPKPVFLLRDVAVMSIFHFGKSNEHVKVKVCAPDSARVVEAVMFFARGALARTLDTLSSGSRIHLLAHVERDTFSRNNPVRLRLLDIRAA